MDPNVWFTERHRFDYIWGFKKNDRSLVSSRALCGKDMKSIITIIISLVAFALSVSGATLDKREPNSSIFRSRAQVLMTALAEVNSNLGNMQRISYIPGNCQIEHIGGKAMAIMIQGVRQDPLCYMFKEDPGSLYAMRVALADPKVPGSQHQLFGPYAMVTLSTVDVAAPSPPPVPPAPNLQANASPASSSTPAPAPAVTPAPAPAPTPTPTPA